MSPWPALIRCARFLVLKSGLELQRSDLELCRLDLEQVLFLLESGTGEASPPHLNQPKQGW